MYELPHELPNDLKLRILKNYEILRKSLKYLELMVSIQTATLKADFDSCARNSEKSEVKHLIEKPILLNFMSLPTIFCLRL